MVKNVAIQLVRKAKAAIPLAHRSGPSSPRKFILSRQSRPNPQNLYIKHFKKTGIKQWPKNALEETLQNNEVYKKLSEFLYTGADVDAHSHSHLRRYYVANKVDNDVARHKSVEHHKLMVLTGPRGSGKSATLRQAYGLSIDPHFEESPDTSAPNRQKNLVVNFWFNNFSEGTKTDSSTIFIRSLKHASDLVGGSRGFNCSIAEIADTIRKTKPSLISGGFAREDKVGSITDTGLVHDLEKTDPLAYAICLFKTTLLKANKEGKPIEKVYLIADDLEADLDNTSTIETVRKFLAINECLHNYDKLEKPSNIIATLSIRPATYDVLKDKLQSPYTLDVNPTFLEPVEILALFERRLDVNLLDTDDNEARRSWRHAFNVIRAIVESLTDSQKNFLIGISNYDIRAACSTIDNIIKNSQWYTPDAKTISDIQDAVNDKTRPLLTQASLVRAVTLGRYASFASRNKFGMPNIFFNQENYGKLLCGPLIASLLYRRLPQDGYTLIEYSKILGAMSLVFSPERAKSFTKTTLEYFEECQAVRLVETSKAKWVVSQPKLIAMWKHLEHSSVLIECFRDDTTIRHFSLRQTDNGTTFVAQPSSELGDASILAGLDFVQSVIETEHGLVKKISAENVFDFQEYFGDQFICSRLMKGLNKSIGAYFSPTRRNSDVYKQIIARQLVAIKDIEALKNAWQDKLSTT